MGFSVTSLLIWIWRAVDQDGEVVDVFLKAKRDGATAKRFFRRFLWSNGGEPRKIVLDKLRRDGVAHRELMPETTRSAEQYENNRAEQSHEATREREGDAKVQVSEAGSTFSERACCRQSFVQSGQALGKSSTIS